MVGVLSYMEHGVSICATKIATRRVVLWKTRMVNLRMDFVRIPLRFVDKINYMMIYGGQE